MINLRLRLLGGAALAIVVALASDTAPAQTKAAHVYIFDIMEKWRDTPGGAGLLPMAEAEAAIALRHAELATERPADLRWMRTHVGHVLNAVDPTLAPDGPGKGYGLIRAAMAVKARAALAAGTRDASRAVELHAGRVARSAGNAARRGEKIIALARRVATAPTAAEAVVSTTAILDVCQQVAAGVDADGDGRISGDGEEGGLEQARRYMDFMMRAEGLR